MFELFKRREFGDYISDTFQFFRQTGKHYLKTYFTISGAMLLLLVVASYFLFQVYFDFTLNTGRDGNANADYLQGYLLDNIAVIILVAVFLFLFIILLSMLNYSIPVLYMDLYDQNKGSGFEVREVLQNFRKKFGKILLFFLGTVFLITPILFVVFALLVLLCFILIGIPMLLLAIPTAFSWIILSFFEYLNNDKGLFEAYGDGFYHIKNQYFPIVGSAMVMYIMIQVSMTVFTFIPYMFGVASVFTTIENPQANADGLSTMKIMMTVVMVISMLASFILNNLLMVNQGLVYYSRREFDENISSNDSIDSIGLE
ncbi:hypothetical protein [Flavobacterium sp. XGLA_31]|uniref:hypothetical protein n=1 Tax=Flavobacterium sp. XGLA_31 TaxID=3447666 RepID=UPI003F36F699